eukprot:3377577-Lingulodinium_polyedra.AAC.1
MRPSVARLPLEAPEAPGRHRGGGRPCKNHLRRRCRRLRESALSAATPARRRPGCGRRCHAAV